MKERLDEIIKSNNIVIPVYLLEVKEALKLEGNLFLLLMYLNSLKENRLNLELFSKELAMEVSKLLEEINSLQKLDLIEIIIEEDSHNIRKESISLMPFYDKVSLFLMSKKEESKETELFKIIEQEFARPLSPIEFEKISSFVEKYASELILEAIKEAVYNGALNINYIGKILFEWDKKGYKTREDVKKHKEEFRKEKSRPKVEMIDYDWFSEDS